MPLPVAHLCASDYLKLPLEPFLNVALHGAAWLAIPIGLTAACFARS